jgi:hypothetical protein
MTKILLEISEARLVLADITSIGMLDKRGIRNGNVMYEVGLAHAVRLPEEVILVRSDKDELLFDVQGIKVHSYEPDDNPQDSQELLCKLMTEALQQVELTKSNAVKETIGKLDFECWHVLSESSVKPIEHPKMKNMRELMSFGSTRVPAIFRLLDRGLLKLAVEKVTLDRLEKLGNTRGEEVFRYEISEFGKAVLKAWTMAITPEQLLEKNIQNSKVD